MKTILTLALGLALSASAQDATQPPATAVVKYTTIGIGTQIYACTDTGKWALQEPKASLADVQTKQIVAEHSKGPTWTWTDGSAVTGKVLQQKPADKTIAWLLLEAHHNDQPGALSDIAYIRRSDTQGGLPPQDAICGQQNVGSTVSVPYQATYTFYTAK